MQAADGPDPFATIYRAVDAISAYDGEGVPAGSLAAIAGAVHRGRGGGWREADVRRAEDISILAHRLAAAARGRDREDSARRFTYAIDGLCKAWLLDMPIAVGLG